MSALYGEGSRALQDRFDARRLADRIEERLVADALSPDDAASVAAADMFFLATADAQGRPTCSYKGGDPGFVKVLDPRTIAFPIWDGNGMYLSAGNVLANPHVGLLFIDFERGSRMRVEGEATVSDDVAAWPQAQFALHVAVKRVYPNCPRYIHKYRLVERSKFVPRAGCATPEPGWKRSDWARDVLPRR